MPNSSTSEVRVSGQVVWLHMPGFKRDIAIFCQMIFELIISQDGWFLEAIHAYYACMSAAVRATTFVPDSDSGMALQS